MNKFLSENSVAKLLLKKGKLDVKLNVCSETFNSPMTLVGFIPYNELDSLEFYNPRIDMNGAIFFGSSVKCVDACRVERIALT